jgi:hypothetical protein
MKVHGIKRVFIFIVFALAASAIFGFVVMHLWNWLAAAVFGWRLISFWQAVGILLLARILFGRLPGVHGPGGYWRARMIDRWEQMTPEEREKFRAGMRGRCGHGEMPPPPATEQKA